ncbi:chorismate synthase [Candidatus Fermentibacterales bacterium]|nr:chorismate synthase [Candidatus Fermentibacterales bacterium]
MTGSCFGHYLRVTTFGESHGRAVGAVVDGVPAGVRVPLCSIQSDLDRRRPGRSRFSSGRREADLVSVLSGLGPGDMTLGSPIALVVANEDARSGDYDSIEGLLRPGHADLGHFLKYGSAPPPGGGRSSGRETVGRVAAGAVARCFLAGFGVSIRSCTLAAGEVEAGCLDLDFAGTNPLRCPDQAVLAAMESRVDHAVAGGDSVGGIVGVFVDGLPSGLGSPVFGRLDACLAGAMLSIGAVKGIEFGSGFELSRMSGSSANDQLSADGPVSNRCGGILGGVSTGQRVSMRLAVKPTPSIAVPQSTIDLTGKEASISVKGRHDPFLCPRIGPVAEAMAALVAADSVLQRMTEVCPAELLSGIMNRDSRYPGGPLPARGFGRLPAIGGT